MGRRHLSRAPALGVAAVALALAGSAGAAVPWRLLADGPSGGSGVAATRAYVASTRAEATAAFSSRLNGAATSKLASVDFSRNAVVAIFGEFGCRDTLIDVTSVRQHGKTLAIALVQHAAKPGTMQCMAIYQTYRFLTVPKSALAQPYPTRATVSLARA